MIFCCLAIDFQATTHIFIKFHQILSKCVLLPENRWLSNKKSSKEMIMGGNKGCRPAQQGLVQKSTEIPHLETCSMQPRGLEGRAQHGHSSGAHSTPRDPCCDARVVVGWLWVEWWCVPNRCTHVHVLVEHGTMAVQ